MSFSGPSSDNPGLLGLGPISLRLIAIGALSLAFGVASPPLAALLAVFAWLLFTWTMWRGDSSETQDPVRVAGWVGLVIIGMSQLVSRANLPGAVLATRWPGAVCGVAACLIALPGSQRRKWMGASMAVAVAGVAIVTGQMISAEWNSDFGTDVYQGHEAAGAAIRDGENPYSEAVRFFNGSPYEGEDAIYEGYPYPPVVLLTYGLAAAFTDPRLVSTLAWFGILAWSARAAFRGRREQNTSMAVFLLLATFPGWPLLWFTSWTEPVSLLCFLAAAVTWRRNAIVSGILLGLALASKQYMIFLAPLVLLHRDEDWVKRVMSAGATILASLLPWLLVDSAGFFTAVVGNPAQIGFRPDSSSIPGLLDRLGLRFWLPQWALLGLGLGFSAFVGRRSNSVPGFVGSTGIILGFVFAAALAFSNYWFLVMGLFSVCLVLETRDRALQGSALSA